MHPTELARTIQHTLLKITATADDLQQLCQEARTHNFQAVCVQPMWVPLAVAALRGSTSTVCAVADFPHGAGGRAAKAAEVRDLVAKGATEVDVVCKIGYLRSGMTREFQDDLAAVVEAAGGAITKVILETSILTDDELRHAIDLAVAARMDYIKTASGFNGPGATVDIINRMRELAAGRVKIKAAGGIRTREDALAMLQAGAQLLGTSSGVAIMQGVAAATAY
ncbi:MAG: deoxyribose-phosphate aldolase [bacterium]|nr:deoxyribose-phosphate aldolase [bacterium]